MSNLNCEKTAVSFILIAILQLVSSLSSIAQNPTSNFNDFELKKLLDSAEHVSKKSSEQGLKLYKEAEQIALSKRYSRHLGLIYKKTGNIHFKKGRLEQSLENYSKCIATDSVSVHSADAYFNIGLIYRKQDLEDKMLESIRKSIKIYSDLKDSESKFNTFYKAGILFKNSAKYHTSLENLLLAYEGFERLNNLSKLASVSTLIANVHRHLGNIELSEKYYFYALWSRMELNDSIRIADSYNSLGNIFKEREILDSAIIYYNKAIALKEEIKSKRELGRMKGNLASVYHLNGSLTEAYKIFLEALQLKKEENDVLGLANTYNELAHISTELGKYNHAKVYLDSVDLFFKKVDDKDFKLRNLESLVFYYESIGNTQKALNYSKEYKNLYQEIFNTKQTLIIQDLQERFESKKRKNEILQLSLVNEEKQNTIHRQQASINKRNILLLLLSIVTIGLVIGYTLVRKIQKKNHYIEKIQAVHSSEDQIKEKISKDLHDVVVSNYEGIKLKLQSIFQNEGLNAKNNTIISQISDINNQIRLISHRLSPLGNKINSATLREIIQSQLVEFQLNQKIEINIEFPLPEELDQYNLQAQTNFYSILLEILNNTGKHSKAKNFFLRHRKDQNKIRFFFSDDGVGFNKNKSEGIGLNNIKQRVELLAGEMNLISSQNGTEIVLEIPTKTNLK